MRIRQSSGTKTPCFGHESNTPQPKGDKCLSSTSHRLPFNCRLSVHLLRDKGDYPEK